MPLHPFALFTTALLISGVQPTQAAEIRAVDVRGLNDAMTGNVREALSLVDAIGKEVSARRLAYLVREAEVETREALEPFGYYSPAVTIAPSDIEGQPVTVTITVAAGAPVTVRNARVAIEGEGSDDRYLREELADFLPRTGDVFEHPRYEASKIRITRRLAERGYFDADFASRKVEVTRADTAADIDLVWTSGDRYDMGATTITQTPRILRPSLLEQLVYWDEGSYYHQGKLDRLREGLSRLDYFAGIDVEPHPESAVDGRVPVSVTLTPAKRSIYTAGLSFGTDSGAGVRLGAERRYLNDRGHKALAQMDWAERRKTFTMQYRIPAFAWLNGWYTVSAQMADEQTDYIDNRRVEIIASRSGEISDYWTAHASLHGLRERWCYRADPGCERKSSDGSRLSPEYDYATYNFPSLRGEYVNADDRLHARDALGATVLLRGGLEAAGSDSNFFQAHTSASWFRGLDERSRLIARGELGRTFSNAQVQTLPPSLRFHAGGDRSIRGYAWREVGPRVEKIDPVTGRSDFFAVGARNVVTASIEAERYFTDSWGAAVFADSGSAFNDGKDLKLRTGVGIGLRWRSPVGPLRIDVVRGLDQPDSPFQLYLNIGADL